MKGARVYTFRKIRDEGIYSLSSPKLEAQKRVDRDYYPVKRLPLG